MSNVSVGSICSGIEAASVAWREFGFKFKWFSEVAEFPSQVLLRKYPTVPNLGDMCAIPEKLQRGIIEAPDIICGGTPCQAFSLAGWKKGLEDHRGNLTLKFVDIIEENDRVRVQNGLPPTIVFWENVEGVLRDKTNAFGCFISSLAGFDKELPSPKWPQAGVIHGPKRNIAWRVLDAKYFGLPQQRRRLYVLAGGKDFYPEQIIFEAKQYPGTGAVAESPLEFVKEGHTVEVFRAYTDCLYSAYGTKWNGNAAAYNGSLFVNQDNRLRRFTPLECERLMGFPDNYTDLPKVKPTARYQSIGNSWAVPVVNWIGKRIVNGGEKEISIDEANFGLLSQQQRLATNGLIYDLTKNPIILRNGEALNCSEKPNSVRYGSLFDVIDVNAGQNFYITPAGCKGILRRKEERRLKINRRLEEVLKNISLMWSDEKIEEISRKQSRGRLSNSSEKKIVEDEQSLSLFGT